MSRRVIKNLARKEKAVERLTELATQRDADEAKALKSRTKLFSGMLKAYNAGMSYDEIADVCGVSKIRVSQILTEVRNGG